MGSAIRDVLGTQFPATYRASSRTEKYPGGPTGNDAVKAGNPDIRVPENLTREDGQRAWRAEEGEAAEAGNPDIRVPENLKREDGQRTWCAEEGKDAERRDAERPEEGDIGEDAKESDSDIEEGDPVNRGPLTS
ncbi:hypothetical protein NDU88_005545 [Pleurodeles waltl]|uniref:Uncharacterized protein n=1 Tax=Pleurodeles waltl TaxID=8319 RepID=A0AAV7NMQ0_PLEWA|nr:hypothetical protein NDU88_005545 [Pleurodeles waltl]